MCHAIIRLLHAMSKACSVHALVASRTQHNSPLKGYSGKKIIGLGDDSRNQLNKWVQGTNVTENRFHRSLKNEVSRSHFDQDVTRIES